MRRVAVAALAAAGLAAGLPPAPAGAQGTEVGGPCSWLFQLGGDQVNATFPDAGARYWGASVGIPPGGYVEIRGRFPHARYTSFTTYTAQTQAIDAIADYEIRPAPGSANPFVRGADRRSERRDYVVRLVNERIPAGGRAPNTLYTENADGSKSTRSFQGAGLGFRVYVPDADEDDTGGVGLPRLTYVFNDGTRVPAESCQIVNLIDAGAQQALAASGEGVPVEGTGATGRNPLHWRKYTNAASAVTAFPLDSDVTGVLYDQVAAGFDGLVPSGGFFENVHNKYLIAMASREHGQVLAVRGRMPTAPKTRYGNPVMGDGQLRYWSLCAFSQTSSLYDCVADEDVPLRGDRRFTVVASTAAARPQNARTECGVAWIPLGPHPQTMLLLRNLLPAPDFREAVQNVEVGREQEMMGAYYPGGTYLRTTRDFERLGCSRASLR